MDSNGWLHPLFAVNGPRRRLCCLISPLSTRRYLGWWKTNPSFGGWGGADNTAVPLFSKKRESVLEVTAVLMSCIIRVSRAETPCKTQIPHSLRWPVRLLTSSRPAPELLIICAGCN